MLDLIDDVIAQMDLSLDGLRVLTEAASGHYGWTPLLAARAGADVVCVANDNRFHRAQDVAIWTRERARELGVLDRVRVIRRKHPDELAMADIVTNTGSLRPLDAWTISCLKPTAVICLMWETWEFLPAQLDLDCARANDILVLGTNEHAEPCDLVKYAGPLGVDLLGRLGVPVFGARVALLGRQPTLGGEMERFLRAAGCRVTGFDAPYDGFSPGDGWDAILVADHDVDVPVIADGGFVGSDEIVAAGVPVAVSTGQVDAAALRAGGITVVPEWCAQSPRVMSASIADLGPRPVLELYAASLRVGEASARARRDGCDVIEAARIALLESPAMDFPGDRAWIRPTALA